MSLCPSTWYRLPFFGGQAHGLNGENNGWCDQKNRARNTYPRYKTKGRDIIHEIKTKNGDGQATLQDAKTADGTTESLNRHPDHTPDVKGDIIDVGWTRLVVSKV